MLDNSQRVCVDELRRLVDNSCRAVVHLQVDWPESIVCLVLMPAHQQTPVWLDPIDPVILVGCLRLQLYPDLNPCTRHRIRGVLQELPRVHVPNDTIRAGFAWFGTSPPNVVKRTTEAVPNAVVEPLALQVRPVCEKDNHP